MWRCTSKKKRVSIYHKQASESTTRDTRKKHFGVYAQDVAGAPPRCGCCQRTCRGHASRRRRRAARTGARGPPTPRPTTTTSSPPGSSRCTLRNRRPGTAACPGYVQKIKMSANNASPRVSEYCVFLPRSTQRQQALLQRHRHVLAIAALLHAH